MFSQVASVVSQRSTCMRLNVGAVITFDNRIISIGYNGTGPGKAHCKGNSCPGKDGCHLTIHAEENAIAYVPESLKPVPKVMYVTDSPCQNCSFKIFDANIESVYFQTAYRITEGLDWLISKGVNVYRVTPSGYVMNWSTKKLVPSTA